MKRGEELYGLPDDMKDLQRSVAHMVAFHQRIGRMWKRIRSAHVHNLPWAFVEHLDEAAGLMVCEHPGCREIVHADWDFCKKHGEPS